jgi:hypothetical protein
VGGAILRGDAICGEWLLSARDRLVAFVVRYKWPLIFMMAVYGVAIVLLLVFSSGPQNVPFEYEIN